MLARRWTRLRCFNSTGSSAAGGGRPLYISLSFTSGNTVRFRIALLLAPACALVSACDFGATDSGSTAPGPSATQLSELARSFTDDLESETNTLTLTLPGAPIGITFAGPCPDSSNTTDASGDGVLDDAILTYSGADCSQTTWRGGSIAVTGSVRVQDPGSGYKLTFNDLAWIYTNPTESLEYTATRNGIRTRTGDADSIRVTATGTTERSRSVITAVATVTKDLLWTFGADDDGAITLDEPLPSGRLAVSGAWNWSRSSEDWALAVSTVTRLHYDTTCTQPQRFTAGVLRLTGRVNGSDGYMELTFSACGSDPTRRWVRG